MFIKSRILLASLVSSLSLIACGSYDAMPAAGTAKNLAATVNGAPISERIVELMLKQRASQGGDVGADARKGFVDRLAMQLLITQEAVKKGLDKSPEVSDRLELMRQSVLVDAFIKDYVKTSAVSDEALKAEYDKIKAESAATEYKARHILVEKEAAARDIIASLKKNPKAFAALAKAKSKDAGSKVNGGDLGWFDANGMVPEFGAAVAQLAKGKFTQEPVKTQFGYHVILLEDSRTAQFPPLEQIKDELTQKLQQENLKKFLDDMKAKAKIEIAQVAAMTPAAEAKPDASPKN